VGFDVDLGTHPGDRLLQLVRHAHLPGCSPEASIQPGILSVPAVADWFLQRCRSEDLCSLALSLLTDTETPGLVLRALAAGALAEQKESTVAEATLYSLADKAESSGARLVAIGGLANAHKDAAAPHLRPAGRVELLAVHSLSALVDVVQSVGGAELLPPPSVAWADRFASTRTLRAGNTQVVIHRTLVGGWAGMRIPIHVLGARTEQLSLNGTTIECLDPPSRLIATALRLAGSASLSCHSARDASLLAARPDVLRAAMARSKFWRVELAVSHGLWRAAQHLPQSGLAQLESLEDHLTPPLYGKAAWWAAARELPWSDRAAFLWPKFWPPRSFLAPRSQPCVRHLADGLAHQTSHARPNGESTTQGRHTP